MDPRHSVHYISSMDRHPFHLPPSNTWQHYPPPWFYKQTKPMLNFYLSQPQDSTPSPSASPKTPKRQKKCQPLENTNGSPSPSPCSNRKVKSKLIASPSFNSPTSCVTPVTPTSRCHTSVQISTSSPSATPSNFKETLSELWGFLEAPKEHSAAKNGGSLTPMRHISPRHSSRIATSLADRYLSTTDSSSPMHVKAGSPGAQHVSAEMGAWEHLGPNGNGHSIWPASDSLAETLSDGVPAVKPLRVTSGTTMTLSNPPESNATGGQIGFMEHEEIDIMISEYGASEMTPLTENSLPSLAQLMQETAVVPEEHLSIGDWVTDPIDFCQLASSLTGEASPGRIKEGGSSSPGSETLSEGFSWVVRGGDEVSCSTQFGNAEKASERFTQSGRDEGSSFVCGGKRRETSAWDERESGGLPERKKRRNYQVGMEGNVLPSAVPRGSIGLCQLSPAQPFVLPVRPQARSRAAAEIFSAHLERQKSLRRDNESHGSEGD